ncbi:hypothetical protein BS78_06G105000 [Paspalum vaginatum]|nr:hypothetical protein BS78_06G105000 [Paspalum vaginatum]
MDAPQQADCNWRSCCGCLAFLAVLGVLVFVMVFTGSSRDPSYSVAIAGVAGLDAAADLSSARPTLSPVFNLTFRINNGRNRLSTACVSGLSTAAVSYEDQFLGRGTVPQFCAKENKVRERGVRAWGHDLDVPPFLRDQLAGELAAGEAYVDVKITTPAECFVCSDTVLVCSKAKIGGGPTPCRKEFIVHQRAEPAAAGPAKGDGGHN